MLENSDTAASSIASNIPIKSDTLLFDLLSDELLLEIFKHLDGKELGRLKMTNRKSNDIVSGTSKLKKKIEFAHQKFIQNLNAELVRQLNNTTTTFNLEAVLNLIDQGANVDKKDRDGCTALMLAAKQGNTKAVIALIDNDANIEDTDIDGCTPFMLAVKNSHSETAIAFVLRKADVVYSEDNRTSLMLAAMYDKAGSLTKAIIMSLCDNEDIDQQDEYGYTALMLAVMSQNINAAKVLKFGGANLLRVRSMEGKTALEYVDGNQEMREAIYSGTNTELEVKDREIAKDLLTTIVSIQSIEEAENTPSIEVIEPEPITHTNGLWFFNTRTPTTPHNNDTSADESYCTIM